MNIFQQDFYTRLRAWHELRDRLQDKDLGHICVEVDSFWQWCPINNHYLHPDDIEIWPGPWELLNDNEYCSYSRALGMIYTLLLLGINDIDVVEATDYNNNEVVLVLVDRAKYILNYWPNTVVNNNLQDFVVTHKIDIKPIITKAGIK